MVLKERDDELTLFLEMRRRENERNNLFLLDSSDEVENSLGPNGEGSPISKIGLSMPQRKTAADNFLNSENEKSDYDWLLTPPGTPLFPSLEMEVQKAKMSQSGMPLTRPTALKSRLASLQEEPASRNEVMSKPSGTNSSMTVNRRPKSSSGISSATRAATPTARPTLTTTAKSSRPSTPTSRPTLPSSKPTAAAMRSSTPTRSTARSSTLTARLTATAPKPTTRSVTPTPRSTSRSATPTFKSSSRSATPTAKSTTRSTEPTTKSTTRSATPTRRPSAASTAPTLSVPPGRSSSVPKSGSTTLKNQVSSRDASPTVKSRPWKPSEMPGFSLDAPPNLRTKLPERPVSATRGRPGAPSVNGSRRQQSCSPSRSSNGSANGNGRTVPSLCKLSASGNDEVNPVVMGSKMVERMVNMRKLAPPKQDNRLSANNNSAGKSSSSLDSSGFGRTISKKSLDMALRHMDIRRSIPGHLRALTSIPASSMYSVRSGSTKSKTISVTDSPIATSSNASSEPSVNNFCLDDCEIGENHVVRNEIGNSPSSH